MAKSFKQTIDQSAWNIDERNFIQQALFDMTGEIPDVFPNTQEVAFDTNRTINLVDLKARVAAATAATRADKNSRVTRESALKAKLNLTDEQFKTLRELI